MSPKASEWGSSVKMWGVRSMQRLDWLALSQRLRILGHLDLDLKCEPGVKGQLAFLSSWGTSQWSVASLTRQRPQGSLWTCLSCPPAQNPKPAAWRSVPCVSLLQLHRTRFSLSLASVTLKKPSSDQIPPQSTFEDIRSPFFS